MKVPHLLAPVAATVLVGIWAVGQRGSVAEQRQAVTELRERIRDARTAAESGSPRREHPAAVGRNHFEGSDGRMDWLSVLQDQRQHGDSSSLANIRTQLRLRQMFDQWSADELADALREIRGLAISDSERLTLEQMLAGPLGAKDPRMTLELMAYRLRDNSTWWLTEPMREWMKFDPSAATAWFDRAIADGLLDAKSLSGGPNHSRGHFEQIILQEMLTTGAAGVESRIAAMEPDQRAAILGRLASGKIEPQRFVSLVRGALDDPAEVSRIITSAAVSKAQAEGFDGATVLLNEGKLNGPERQQAVAASALGRVQQLAANKPLDATHLDEMRAWVRAESPGTEDQLTGQAIARALNSGNGGHAAEGIPLLTHYHDSSGNHEVLASFIEAGGHRSRQTETAALVEKIADPVLRRELLEKLK